MMPLKPDNASLVNPEFWQRIVVSYAKPLSLVAPDRRRAGHDQRRIERHDTVAVADE